MRQNRSRFAWLAALGLYAGGGSVSLAGPARPNIVLVITDDQGYGEISAHGNPLLKTPNMDRLHAQSVRLTDFHVDPTCSPTRSALLTGRYSSRTGVWHTVGGRSLMRTDELTLAESLRDAGYRTAIFGKWHLGDNYPLRAQDQGFETTFTHGGGGVGQTPDVWGNDYFDDTYRANGVETPVVGYCTDVWFDRAIRYIDETRQDQAPFYVHIATNAPHAPYRVDPRYSAAFEGQTCDGKPVNAAFYGMIANLDENLGRLLDRLDAWGLAENTIVVFLTDNGSASPAFNAGMREAKGSVYDGGHRVPCFIRWPAGGIGGGRDVPQLTAHLDLLPTLLALTGVERPAEAPPLDGISLARLLRGDEAGWPADRTLFVHSQRVDVPVYRRNFAVLTERYRLVQGSQLHDILADPGQSRDISAENPEVLRALNEAYDAWWQSIAARFHEPVRIVLGAAAESPTRLTAHDWHGDVPFDQDSVRRLPRLNAPWALEIARPGRYRFTLSHQPAVEPRPLEAVTAELRVWEGDDRSAPARTCQLSVMPGAPEVSGTLDLPAGPVLLETRLVEAPGPEGKPTETQRGAFFVMVDRLDDAP